MDCLESILLRMFKHNKDYFKIEYFLHLCMFPSIYKNLSAFDTMQAFSCRETFQRKYIKILYFDEGSGNYNCFKLCLISSIFIFRSPKENGR